MFFLAVVWSLNTWIVCWSRWQKTHVKQDISWTCLKTIQGKTRDPSFEGIYTFLKGSSRLSHKDVEFLRVTWWLSSKSVRYTLLKIHKVHLNITQLKRKIMFQTSNLHFLGSTCQFSMGVLVSFGIFPCFPWIPQALRKSVSECNNLSCRKMVPDKEVMPRNPQRSFKRCQKNVRNQRSEKRWLDSL